MCFRALGKPAALAAAVCAAVLASSSVIWAQKIDFSKLKRGDKLEYFWFDEWHPCEFIQRETFNRVKIKESEHGWERTVPMDEVRLPPGLKKKAGEGTPAHPENPFATGEEKASALKQRTWSDKSGKFKIEATLVKVDGANVILMRSDQKEVPVPLDKLSDADKKYVADYQAGKALDGKPEKSSGGEEAERTLLPLTKTDLNSAKFIEIDGTPEWTYQPDMGAKPALVQNARVSLQNVEWGSHATKLFLLPEQKKAFVIFGIGHGPWEKSVVQACDLARGKLEGVSTFPEGEKPLAVSPDGKYVLARTDKFHHGTKGELRLYAREGKKIDQVACWQPYNHHRSPFPSAAERRRDLSRAKSRARGNAGPMAEAEETPEEADEANERPELGFEADVEWAEFIDPNHILTMSHGGELAMWKAPEIEPLYVIKGRISQPALSPGMKFLAVAVKQGIAIMRAADGEPAGLIPLAADNSSGSIAFRPDGRRLALVQGGQWSRVRVWDLESQEVARDFAVKDVTAGWMTNATWVGEDHLLTGSTVIDLVRRVPIWRYNLFSKAWQFYGDKAWYVNEGLGRDTKVLTSAKVPPKEAVDAVAKFKPEDLLLVRPGLEVEVDLQGGNADDLEKAREAVHKRLEENDMRVVPQSKVKLVGRIQPGETKMMQYVIQERPAGGLPFPHGRFMPHVPTANQQISTQSVTEQILSLSFEIDGKSVWKYEQKTSPPGYLSVPPDKTIEQALAEHMEQNASSFGQIWVPSYVAAVPGADEKEKQNPGQTP
jgi:WD40 repeat protein